MIHFSSSNQYYNHHISLYGIEIPKIKTRAHQYVLEMDKSKITYSFNRATCLKCLELLVIQRNNELSLIVNRFKEIENGTDKN